MPPASTQQVPTLPFPSPSTIQPSSLSRLTLSDKLLLSQAVHHIGTSPPDWGRVSSILLSHPLIKTKSRLEQAQKAGITLGRVFGSRECERAWVALMRQYNLVLQPGEKDPSLEPESDAGGAQGTGTRTKEARGLPPRMDRGSQLALAQYLYAERIREIQDTIKAKETEFKQLVEEIDKLNAGASDDKLLDEMERLDAQREQEAAAAAVAAAAAASGHDEDGNPIVRNVSAGAEDAVQSSQDVSVSSTANSTPVKVKDIELPPPKSATAPLTPIKDVQGSRKNSLDASKKSVSPAEERRKVVKAGEVRPETTAKVGEGGAEAGIVNPVAKEAGPGTAAIAGKAIGSGTQREAEKEAIANIDAAMSIVNGVSNKRKLVEEGDLRPSEANADKRTKLSVSDAATPAVSKPEDEDKTEPVRLGDELEVDEAQSEDTEMWDTAAKEENAVIDAQKEEADGEDLDDEAAESSAQRPEPRRSRRSARHVSNADDEAANTPTPTPTPDPSSAAAKNTRLEALRSREASGTSAEPDDSAETVLTDEAEAQRTGLSRARSSLSPVSARRGKSTSGRAGTGQRRSARGSSTGIGGGNNDDSLAGSDVERERTTTASSNNAAERAAKDRKMEKVLMLLLGEVSNHTHGNLFHAPIKETDAPDYFQLIRHPLDLKTIKGRIKDGKISTSTQLRRALMQMFANSLIYNRPGSDIHRMALEMRDAAEEMLDRFEQTQLSASYTRR